MAEEAPVRPLNTSAAMLIYGASGSGKSSQIALAALYVAKHYKKRTRLFSYDEGGWPDIIQDLIDHDIIEACRATTIDPLGKSNIAAGSMSRFAKGYWPARVRGDGTIVDSELLPPSIASVTLVCPNEHAVFSASTREELVPQKCPQCATMVTQQNGRIRRDIVVAPHAIDIGLYVHDSLTAACLWVKNEMDAQAAVGGLGGGGGRGGGRSTIRSGEDSWGDSGWTGIGFTQARAAEWSMSSASVFGIVAPTIWTARDIRVTPKDQAACFGPDLIGVAATPGATGWYGNSVNTAVVKGEHRIYLREWKEEDDTTHRCKVRSLPSTMPDFLARTAEEAAEFESTGAEPLRFGSCSIAKFFDMSVEARAKVGAFVASWDLDLPVREARKEKLEQFGAVGPQRGGPPRGPLPAPRPAPLPPQPARPTAPAGPVLVAPVGPASGPVAVPPARPAGPKPPMRMVPPGVAPAKKE